MKKLMFHQVMGKHYFNPYIHYILMEKSHMPHSILYYYAEGNVAGVIVQGIDWRNRFWENIQKPIKSSILVSCGAGKGCCV